MGGCIFSPSLLILDLYFSDILKGWADTLLIREQSMKLRNSRAAVTNPKGKEQFDPMEWS